MDKDFKEYLKNAKNRFKEVIIKYPYELNKELHAEFDSFLLAYEQAESKALILPSVGLRSEQLPPYCQDFERGKAGCVMYGDCELCSNQGNQLQRICTTEVVKD